MNIKRFSLSKFASLFLAGSTLFLVSELVGEQITIPVALARPTCASLLSEYETVDSRIQQLHPSIHGLSNTLARLYQRREELKQQIEAQNCTDLAAVGWCYFLNEAVPRIEFHPVIRNNGAIIWRTDREGKYRIVVGWSTGTGGWEELKADHTLRGYPYWWLDPWKTEVLDNSITMPFSENRLYAFGSWELSHPEDSNPNNNRYSAPDEIRKGIAGKEFKRGGSMNSKKCTY